LLDREFQAREHQKQARFKLCASVQDIDYQHRRNLKKAQVRKWPKSIGWSGEKNY
jgi:hypothetical protein